MPTIRYHEFRPGRWVKLVDGKAVGPATAEEVAAWKHELAGQAEIWEDVLKHAAPAQAAPAAPEPAQTGQPDRPAAPPTAPQEAKPAALPKPSTPPRILRTVEEIRAAKVAPRVEVIEPASHPVQEQPAASPSLPEQLQAPWPAVEGPAPTAKLPTEAKTATVAQPTPEAKPSLPMESVGMAPSVEETARPETLGAAVKSAVSQRSFESLIEPAEGIAAVSQQAEAEGLPSLPTLPGAQAEEAQPEPEQEPAAGEEAGEAEKTQPEPEEPAAEEEGEVEEAGPEPEEELTAEEEKSEAEETQPELEEQPAAEKEEAEEAEPELEERPSTQEGEAETEEAAEEWEEKAEAQPSEATTGDGVQQVGEAETLEEASYEEEAPPAYVRHGRAAARAGAAKRRAGLPSDEVKGPQYLWFVTEPADDLVAAVRGGLAKYQERFGQPAGVVLCHALDLPALEDAAFGLDVRQSKGVPPHNFWIGPK